MTGEPIPKEPTWISQKFKFEWKGAQLHNRLKFV